MADEAKAGPASEQEGNDVRDALARLVINGGMCACCCFENIFIFIRLVDLLLSDTLVYRRSRRQTRGE